MNLVVVESPTKAKSIEKYLGDGWTVLASRGHVRDLPEKDGSVLPDQDFKMIWEVQDDRKQAIDQIARAMRDADALYLATDPDREGEAISWHLLEALKERRAVKDQKIHRVIFHEVTKPAVLRAMAEPRELRADLVDAYRARRGLDYLVGFTLSPLLWRKLKGSRSAGRVQSVALRLICEREAEIEAFVPREYWSVEALLKTAAGETFSARLTHLDGKKLDKFALGDRGSAEAAVAALRGQLVTVRSVEKKQATRNPSPPFSTSTLQQEAARKLGFGADRTMRTAQRLFEGVSIGGETVGLITYMRTDSVQLSADALAAARRLIGQRFGDRYLPEQPRQFKTRTKNAQEAHEAIRPTDLFRTPQEVARHVDEDQRRLYELIWQRTIASQMASAILDRVIAEIDTDDRRATLRAVGQTIAFDGFLKLYREGRDDPTGDEEDDEDSRILPPLAAGDRPSVETVTPTQHFTEPPPRYSEASLVKKLEELGIGRPSTYASILSVLQQREYVKLEQKRFVPQPRGRVVNAFLVSFFEHWVEPGFTASLENQLDEVAAGEVDWKQVLRDFWTQFHARVAEVEPRRPSEVIEALDAFLGPALFPKRADGSDPRACPACGTGRLSLKLGKFGGFVGCSNYPECRFTRQLGEGEAEAQSKERLLGIDPANAEEVWLRSGRFGPYVQRGQGEDAKRCSLPRGMSPGDLDLATALRLLALPREIGPHPETGQMITAGIGRYGAYVESGGRYVTLPPDENVLEVGINRATVLLAEAGKGKGRGVRAAAEARELGKHPKDGQPVSQGVGRFGPYVRHNKLFASIPRAIDPAAITLEQALALLAAKAGKPKPERPASATRAKAAGATAEPAAARPKPRAEPKPAAKAKPRRATRAKAAASPRRAARTES